MALPDLPSLIRAELPGHAWRLLYLRYICAAGTLFGAFILTQNMGAVLDPLPLYATAAAILLSNGLYTAHLIAAGRKTGIASSDAASRSVALQCATDVFLLTLLLHFSGGAANPLMALYVGPILITGLLLSVRATYLVATLSGLFFAGMAILEYHPARAGSRTLFADVLSQWSVSSRGPGGVRVRHCPDRGHQFGGQRPVTFGACCNGG